MEAQKAACHDFSLTRFKGLQSIANIASTCFIQFYLKPVIDAKVQYKRLKCPRVESDTDYHNSVVWSSGEQFVITVVFNRHSGSARFESLPRKWLPRLKLFYPFV